MRHYSLAILALLLLFPTLCRSEETAPPSEKAKSEDAFLRLLRDKENEPISLDTAIVRYRTKEGAVVDLIGVIHIGDQSYYELLNKEFTKYEAVLYELVAAEGTRIPKGGREGGSALGGMQSGMGSMLELAFQLEHIDYTKENLVHADMSPEEFAKSMKERGESWVGMFFRMMGQSAAMQANNKNGASDIDLFAALFARDRALRLKKIMAQQFENLEGNMAALEGKDGSALIAARNIKALEVLQKQLDAGQKNLAIFYGAGHCPDFEQRLIADFGCTREETRWFAAWNLQPKGKKESKPEEESIEKEEAAN